MKLKNGKKMENGYQILGDFLKSKFSDIEFYWDDNSKGWYSFDESFVSRYSRNYVGFNERLHINLKNSFNRTDLKLIILDDFYFVGFTID